MPQVSMVEMRLMEFVAKVNAVHALEVHERHDADQRAAQPPMAASDEATRWGRSILPLLIPLDVDESEAKRANGDTEVKE